MPNDEPDPINSRPDLFMARLVDEGLDLQKTYGYYEAAIFMMVHGVPFNVVVRVRVEPGHRRLRLPSLDLATRDAGN